MNNKEKIAKWRKLSQNKKLIHHNQHVIQMIDLLEQQAQKIDELEKELKDANECLTIAYLQGCSDCKKDKKLAIRDLEQQAKGLEDYADNLASDKDVMWVIDRAVELREQAERLRGE